jgi:PAS domain S-box-containing protein
MDKEDEPIAHKPIDSQTETTLEALQRSLAEATHSQRLLLALNQAAQALQRARTTEAVYRAIGEQTARLGLDTTVFTLSDDQTHMIVAHLTLKSALVRAAEKLTGLSAKGYCFPIKPDGFFQRVIASKEAMFDDIDAVRVAETLPRPVRSLAGRLIDLLGWQQSIYAPLTVGNKVWGLLAVTGTDLTESDLPAVTAFANQAAIAIENARLYKETQQLATFNENIVQSIAEGIVVEDANGIFTFVNPAAAEMLGYPRDELVGLHWKAIISPDQRPLVQAANERRLRGASDRYELELVRKDGRRITVLIAGSPRIDEAGSFAGTMAVFTDISDFKRTEAALQESEKKYRLLVEHQTDLLVKVDTEGLNYQALEAANGQEALALMEERGEHVAVVLSDVVMPGMGGIALFRALREKGWQMPMILLTGHPMGKELDELQVEGLSAWMTKPPTLEHLGQLIAQIIGQERGA